MSSKLRRRHRGFSGLFEAIVCVFLVGVTIVMLLRVMSYTATIANESQVTIRDQLSADFLVEALQIDTKSAKSITVTENDLKFVVGDDDKNISYRVIDGTLFRNTEAILEDIQSCTFIPGAEDGVGIYIYYGDNQIIDMMISK